MVTNGGPHPPEKWADVTARAIAALIVIEPTAPTQAIVDKREFEMALFKLLIEQHKHVQDSTRTALAGTQHVDHHRLVVDRAADAANGIAALVKSTRFAEHFDKPEVKTFLHNVIGQHFADSVHIEHGWHKDRNRKS